jgi:uncharacterized protein DUF6496
MPWKTTKQRARHDKRRGKSSSTQAGEYVEEQMHKYKHGGGRAKNPKQAIAIGLSEARREGVSIPKKGKSAAKKRSSSGRSQSKATKRHRSSSSGGAKRSSAKRSSSSKRSSGSKKTASRSRSSSSKRSR